MKENLKADFCGGGGGVGNKPSFRMTQPWRECILVETEITVPQISVADVEMTGVQIP